MTPRRCRRLQRPTRRLSPLPRPAPQPCPTTSLPCVGPPQAPHRNQQEGRGEAAPRGPMHAGRAEAGVLFHPRPPTRPPRRARPPPRPPHPALRLWHRQGPYRWRRRPVAPVPPPWPATSCHGPFQHPPLPPPCLRGGGDGGGGEGDSAASQRCRVAMPPMMESHAPLPSTATFCTSRGQGRAGSCGWAKTLQRVRELQNRTPDLALRWSAERGRMAASEHYLHTGRPPPASHPRLRRQVPWQPPAG